MLSGLLLVDKPRGITSMQVVEEIKSKFHVKAGHAGTLDPLATGLLLVLLGQATKLSEFFQKLDKAYIAKAKLGEITDTYDAEGRVVESREVKVDCQQVKDALRAFRGKIMQKPPPYSAKRIGGKRAYELARMGVDFEIKPVEVEVYRAELLACDMPYVELYYEVSSGTYIRSLVHDLGIALSCGAHVVELRRTKVGPFEVSMAVGYHRLLSLEDIGGLLISPGDALSFLPKLTLSGPLAQKVKRGGYVELSGQVEETFVRLYEEETFIGVGLIKGRVLKPYRMFVSP